MVPVGMAMQDGPSSTVSSWGGIGTDVVAQYYAGGDATQRADFVGINTYRYVNTDEPGPMNAYDGLANEVAALPVPVFLTESGGLFKDTSGKAKYPRDWKIVGQVYQEPLLYQNLSGQVAFQFFNKKEDMGLYTESPLATPNPFTASGSLATTTYGGANALATAFLNASSVTVPLASSVPDPSQCPSSCDPALLPCPGATISITVENYASKDLKAVQGGAVIADLPAGSQSTPSKTQVMVSGAANLLIQDPDGWLSVCQVVASKLSAGRVVRNNVAWGAGVACELS
jgi:hypothetical protein